MFVRLLVLVTVLNFALSDFNWGSCPDIRHEIDTFDLSKYLGKWYEIARSEAMPFEKYECVQAEYSIKENGNIEVKNSQYDGKDRLYAIGEAVTTSDPFALKVSFSDSILGKLFSGNYQVINTDYSNYSIVYSCTNVYVAHVEFIWILSRQPNLPQEQTETFLHYIQNVLGFSRDSLHFTDQGKDYCGY